MGLIRSLQEEHQRWLSHNFPQQRQHQPLLGIVEELGELAHVHLKSEQGIREGAEDTFDLTRDALGDIFVYMLSYANSNHVDLEDAIVETWTRVKKRDWIADPVGGGE